MVQIITFLNSFSECSTVLKSKFGQHFKKFILKWGDVKLLFISKYSKTVKGELGIFSSE
ncbi:hypothetical protein [Pseudoalteromonas prydzensis]|uniref:hypothetical protein n=1 Tax=Pseudoalteromonas prydzensis TaxID=182141 RepID=UPI003FCC51ED